MSFDKEDAAFFECQAELHPPLCKHCGGLQLSHGAAPCHRIKRVRYSGYGEITEVEYFSPRELNPFGGNNQFAVPNMRPVYQGPPTWEHPISSMGVVHTIGDDLLLKAVCTPNHDKAI